MLFYILISFAASKYKTMTGTVPIKILSRISNFKSQTLFYVLLPQEQQWYSVRITVNGIFLYFSSKTDMYLTVLLFLSSCFYTYHSNDSYWRLPRHGECWANLNYFSFLPFFDFFQVSRKSHPHKKSPETVHSKERNKSICLKLRKKYFLLRRRLIVW